MKIRFSLKWLMVVVIGVAVLMGVIVKPMVDEHREKERKRLEAEKKRLEEHRKWLTERHNQRAKKIMDEDPTDKGLERLKELKYVTRLHLRGLVFHTCGVSRSKISDKGLEHLKGLTNLKELELSWTEISDKGLEHLKGLTNLKELSLYGTKVSDQGVKELQKALPDCKTKWKP